MQHEAVLTNTFRKYQKAHGDIKNKVVSLPKYARVNTLKASIATVVGKIPKELVHRSCASYYNELLTG